MVAFTTSRDRLHIFTRVFMFRFLKAFVVPNRVGASLQGLGIVEKEHENALKNT